MNSFPILDGSYGSATAQLGRVILDFNGHVEPHIDEVDYWCAMPLRLTHDQGGGFRLECGPYSLSHTDIERLREAIPDTTRRWESRT